LRGVVAGALCVVVTFANGLRVVVVVFGSLCCCFFGLNTLGGFCVLTVGFVGSFVVVVFVVVVVPIVVDLEVDTNGFIS
jgi:hypothetical protein